MLERRQRTEPPVADAAEADLLAKAREGNAAAFEDIVRRYQRRVYAVALRVVRRHEVADDVAQEAFLKAYRSLDQFDLARPFGPWVCRIAANLAINQVRSPRWREQELDEVTSPAPSTDQGPLEGVLDVEAGAQLEAAMETLSPEQRAVFTLRALEELSYQEIADALGISIGTVMSRLSRARERLRAALGPYLAAGRAVRRERA